MIAVLAFSACTSGNKATTEEATNMPSTAIVESAKESTGKMAIAAYLELKDALVESSIEKAQLAAKKVAEYLSSNTNVTTQAELIATSDDINAQRAAFETLSVSLYDQLKVAGSSTLLYKQHCPMAFDNKGAYWLSDKEEIRNPYFGDMMLKCGSVTETIAANE